VRTAVNPEIQGHSMVWETSLWGASEEAADVKASNLQTATFYLEKSRPGKGRTVEVSVDGLMTQRG
jgi:hypothetical protein